MKIMYVNLGTGACGGVRIICEHLNRLTERGHECYMGVMSGEPVLDWMPINFPIIGPRQLDAKAKDMDILVATEANTAEPVARMQTTAKKFYFIQMRESLFFVNGDPLWAGTVEANYKRLKGVLSPIVISWWLKDFLEEIYGYEDIPIVPNGLNEKMFYPDPAYPKGHLPRVLIEGHTHGEAKDIRNIAKAIVDAYKKQVRPVEVWGFSQLEPTDGFRFDMFSLMPTQDEIRKIYSSCDVIVKASRFEGRSCLAEGTLIPLANTVKPIEKVSVGDLVLGKDGQFHQVMKRQERHYRGELVRVTARTTTGEPLLLTPDHPVLAMRTASCVVPNHVGVCKPNCQRQVNPNTGENTRCSKRPYEQYELEWMEAGDLKKGDALVMPYPTFEEQPQVPVDKATYTKVKGGLAWDYMTNKSSVSIPEFLPTTKGAMELYGLYLAEGWTSDGKVEFALHAEEIELAQKILGVMGEEFDLKGRVSPIPNEQAIKLTFYHSVLSRTFKYLFGPNAKNKRIPRGFLMALPDQQIRLLEGFWRGDGCTGTKSFRMHTVSPALAFGLRTLAFRCGLLSSVYKRQNPPSEIDGRKVKGGPIYEIRIGGPHRYAFSDIVGEPMEELSKTYETTWANEHLHFMPVDRIEAEFYNGTVYDLTVPTIQHFATVSGITHNCVDPEAMACGTAIVRAIDKGDDDLIHGYNCLKVGYDIEHPQKFQENVNKMFNHLVAVLAEDRLRQALITNGLTYVKNNLRWGPFVDRLETIYDGGTPPPLPRTEHVSEDEV